MTEMVAKLDDMGKPVWVALTVLSLVVFWPIGLAVLAFLLSSGRLGGHRGRMCGSRMSHHRWTRPYPATGNAAFDEYREHTLVRLEEEQEEFQEFLRQLRMAKDRTEFDRFMRGRRAHDVEPEPEDEGDASAGDPGRVEAGWMAGP